MPLNRREFLTLRVAEGRSVADVSCEQLYMRWIDARADGATGALFARLAEDVARAEHVRLVDTAWLSDAEFRRELEVALNAVTFFKCAGPHSHA